MSKSSKEEKSNTLKRSWFQELKGEFRKITWLAVYNPDMPMLF